jgi:redox-sensing transcriptional repressor
MALSNNATERICRIFGHLKSLEKNCVDFVSSRDLAKAISATEYTVRKDISSLNITGHTRKGYQVKLLKEELGHKLQLTQKRKACIVGLGRLGAALLDYENFQEDGFQIVAGFDCSINRIERIHPHIDVFAVNQLETIVKERGIELGIITVPEQAAQEISDQLCRAGIKGILNFSPAKIIVPKNIIHLDMDFTSALRFIAVRLSIS